MKTYQRGFTLIELLVVIAIISLLSSILISSLLSARDKAMNSRTVSQNAQFARALILYSDDHNGAIPSTIGMGVTINEKSFMCLGPSCIFNNTVVDSSLNTYISSYIPESASTALKEYKIGPQNYGYKGTVFTCFDQNDEGCIDGRFFFPYTGACPTGSLAIMTDSISSLCMQNIDQYMTTTSESSSGLDDTDGDGIPDVRDNCLYDANTDQLDANANGKGDACERFSCQGTFTDNCMNYYDYPSCTDGIRSGYCQFVNYRPPECTGNYTLNCSDYHDDASACAQRTGCFYEDATQTCYGGLVTGTCNSSWDQNMCGIMSGCAYDTGQAGSCQAYGYQPQCSYFDEFQCSVNSSFGCSWQSDET